MSISPSTPTPDPPDQSARTTITTELDRTLFVEAGAGTGKTRQLVDRIVQLVVHGPGSGPVRLSEIAAITFTEAAAAELRDRIRRRLEQVRRDAEQLGDGEAARRCRQAIEDADVAAISTLHAFAQRLLSEFPVEVGIPPRVEVVDEVQSQIDFEHRWSEFVDELFDDTDAEAFMVRAAILGAGIGGRHQHLRDLAHQYDDNWDRLENIGDTAPLVAPVDVGAIRAAVRELSAYDGECSADDDRLLLYLRSKRSLLERFLIADSEPEQLRLLVQLCGLRCSQGQKKNWPDKAAVVAAIEAVADRASAVRDEVVAQTLDLLSRRVARFTVRSAAERRAEGRLAFHDLLVLARLLLRHSDEARHALSARYRILLLDEFQDTDPIQIELALLLAMAVDDPVEADWRKISPESGRLFMVGDPKQSIYRFRRADIALYLEARDKFAAGSVSLTTNFRTVPEVIAAVNGLFGGRMPTQTDAQPAYEALGAHRVGSGRADHRPLVIGGGLEARAGELRQLEADHVADIVADIGHHRSRWPVFDDTTGDWRLPERRDVTILLPTRTSLRQLTAALDARDIPYRADTGTLVYETQEVRSLLSVLRAVADPTDQISLVAALRSPLYAIGDDELYRFRRAGGRFDLRVPPPDAFADGAVAAAMSSLGRLADDKWWLEPSQLLLRVIEERGANVLALDHSRARDTWRRLRYLVDQARAFSEAGGGDLRAYLDWTALQGSDGSRAHEPMLPEADDDAVQIMTVHGAKGLEFPITIVSGLTTRVQGRRRGVGVLWGEPGTMPAVSLDAATRSPGFDVRADLEAQMDRPERDRLLYVAMTRARDHLVISGYHDGSTTAAGELKVDCHGRTVAEFAAGAGAELVRRSLRQERLFIGTGSPVAGGIEPSAAGGHRAASDVEGPAVDRDSLISHRQAVIEQASAVGVRSATALARLVRNELTEADDEVPGDDGDAEGSLPPQTFRRGRAGTAIGSAVHGVLQLLDLAAPDDGAVEQLVDSQAWAEAVPEHRDTIARSVHSALAADIVQRCRSNRHWKELFVAAPVGEITVEGYVDLLVETDAGLVVVDYKTDAVDTDADIDAKLEGYAVQGAAYAAAVETATGRPVVDVQFVFTRPSGPIVRSIDDLEAVRSTVRRLATAAGAMQ